MNEDNSKRRLGRGLAALIGEMDQLPAADLSSRPSVNPDRMVPIEFVGRNPRNPRRHFDEAELDHLASSLKTHGLVQPLLVRETGPDAYEIVAGERRWRAAQRAGLHELPVVVREVDDREALEIAIVENVQRADLNPIDEAAGYEALATEHGHSHAEIAEAIGKSRSHVANTLRLLTLDDAVLAALEEGLITAGHARAVLAQPEADRAWAFQEIVTKGLSVRQAEQLKRPAARTSKGPKASPYRGLEEDLSRHAGTRVRITGGKRGKIELHFHGEDELQRLLDLLGYRA